MAHSQNSKISFGYVDSHAKTFLILYPSLENSTTPIAILWGLWGLWSFWGLTSDPDLYFLNMYENKEIHKQIIHCEQNTNCSSKQGCEFLLRSLKG